MLTASAIHYSTLPLDCAGPIQYLPRPDARAALSALRAKPTSIHRDCAMGVGLTARAGATSFHSSITLLLPFRPSRLPFLFRCNLTHLLQWLANPNMLPGQSICLEAFYEAHLLTEVIPRARRLDLIH